MHSRQANDAVASERSIFSKNHGRGLDARGGRKLRTDTHTHTRDNHSNNNNKDYSKR